MSSYVQLTETTFCERQDTHPGVLAVAMDGDFGAYWCQECVNFFLSDEWIDVEGVVPLIPVVQP